MKLNTVKTSKSSIQHKNHNNTNTAVITDEIAEFLNKQRLGYVATASASGRPNVSPKGTIRRFDKNTLTFAIIRSPDTVKNLKENDRIEINVIDPILRRGYLFEGTAKIVTDSDTCTKIVNDYKKTGIKNSIKNIIMVNVTSITNVLSPLYDIGVSEEEIKSKWIERTNTQN